MKVFAINRHVKKVALQVTEKPEPKLVNNEVLVQVHAIGEHQLACATTASALCESTTN